MAALAPAYRPRRPTETILYTVVRDHLATFLAHARETYAAPLPRYVQEELRGYLRCGVFAHGFVRAHCDACGHDLLVAFSCKARGVCPSCAGRRMANTAAHLVDRVLPAVPVRQWVLSLPFELRRLAAFDAKVLAALARIFAEALSGRYRVWGRGAGLGSSETGAVTFVQRFGSSLNLNVQFARGGPRRCVRSRRGRNRGVPRGAASIKTRARSGSRTRASPRIRVARAARTRRCFTARTAV